MLHMKPHIITEYEIRDKNGNVKNTFSRGKPKFQPDKLIINVMTKSGIIKQHREQPFASWLANFMKMIYYGWMAEVNDTGATLAANKIITHATGGSTFLTDDLYQCDVTEAALAVGAANVYGIMIGDMDNNTGLGLTQESGIGNIVHYNDYMLRALLTNDEIVTPPTTKTDLETRDTNLSMPDDNTLLITRRFQNDSAIDIYVDECGLIGTEDDNNEEVMLARDILGSGADPAYITVEPTEIIEISYTFTLNAGANSGLTQNWLRYLSSLLGNAAPVSSMKNTSNSATLANPSTARTDQDMAAAQDADTHGIVIGGYLSNGTPFEPSPFAVDNWSVANKLLDSEIDYGPMVKIVIDLETTYTQFGMYRDFENDNTTTVYVKDSGLYMKDATLTDYHMMARDVLSDLDPSYIQVLPAEILRVKYYMKFSI